GLRASDVGPAALRRGEAALAVAEGPRPTPRRQLGPRQLGGGAGVGARAGGVPVAGRLVGEGVDGGLDARREAAGVLGGPAGLVELAAAHGPAEGDDRAARGQLLGSLGQ